MMIFFSVQNVSHFIVLALKVEKVYALKYLKFVSIADAELDSNRSGIDFLVESLRNVQF